MILCDGSRNERRYAGLTNETKMKETEIFSYLTTE